MRCCVNCFVDREIQAIIASYGSKGSCDICGASKISVYEVGSDDNLSEVFDGLLDAFTPVSSLPTDFPRDRADLLKNILCKEWPIFGIEPSQAYTLLVELCSRRYADQPELFDSPVVVQQKADKEYLGESGLFGNDRWEDFVNEIKRENRFHAQKINIDILEVFLKCTRKVYRKGEVFYRARQCFTLEGFKPSKMGPPPHDKASAGRVNAEGVSVLYLSDSEETTLYETRAGIYDYVTVGKFILQKDIEVVDLAGIDKISPFVGIDRGFDITKYAINIEHLKTISREIARPLRRQDSLLDYLPTQFISDYIKRRGYDGIEFSSAIRQKGTNYAIFDPSLLKCTKTSTYEINSIHYNYE